MDYRACLSSDSISTPKLKAHPFSISKIDSKLAPPTPSFSHLMSNQVQPLASEVSQDLACSACGW